jgi:hypothetical protein
MIRTLLAAVLFCSSAFAGTVRLQCGGVGGADVAGQAWDADSSFTGGLAWTTAAAPAITGLPVPYNRLRYGASFSYSFALAPATTYTVTLKLVEPRAAQTAGQRVFSVSINGAVVLPSLDLFAVAGALVPKDYTFPVVTTASGVVAIIFSASVGNAVISGIQIDGPPPVSTSLYSDVFAGGAEYQTQESCLKGITVPFGAVAVPYPFQQIPIATVPAGWSPRTVQVEETDTFVSGSPQVTALSTSVGTLADPAYYLPTFALMRPAPNFRADNAGGQAAQLTAHTLYLSVSVANANPGPLTGLTAGSLSVKVCGVQLQGALPILVPGNLTVGTLVNGACMPQGTGFHVDGAPSNATLLSNEAIGNCLR